MTEIRGESSGDTLRPGHRIAHYEVLSFLGCGGMGEVYRARDHRLEREVALKVLPARFSEDESRGRRFAREAITTGSINHPNIVSVFDAGECEGRGYLVTELLSGDTLRQQLEQSAPMAIPVALDFGVQIARGLAAAHDRGVIHRDLKPSNIFVTRDGHVKILDFGLAKFLNPELAGVERDDETISVVTNPGAILGSVGYMSPEQIEARPADQRSDVFSLGAVLYEMLTGVRAFSGSSPVATLSAILKDEPPELATIRPDISKQLSALVHRCLEKRPADRQQSARDLAFNLEQLRDGSGSVSRIVRSEPPSDAVKRFTSLRAIGAAAALALVVAATALVSSNWTTTASTKTPAARPPATGPVEIERLTSEGEAGTWVSISPDASYVVFDSSDGLWLTHVATRSRVRLVEGGQGSFSANRFSPDGNYVYFIRRDADSERWDLFRTAILGGEPRLVARDVRNDILAIAPAGQRIGFVRESGDERTFLTAAPDGTDEVRVAVRKAPAAFIDCSWSPDGSRFLCAVWSEFQKKSMIFVDATTGEQSPAEELPPLVRAEWLSDGSGLIGMREIGTRLQVTRVAWPGGESTPMTSDLATYHVLSVPRDDRTVAALRIDTTTNLWSVAGDGLVEPMQLTTGVNTADGNFGVAAAPDGRIIWASGATGRSVDLMIAREDGSGRARLTFDDDADEVWPDVSRDGTMLAYARNGLGEEGGSDIWRTDLKGAQPVRLTKTNDSATPRFSADGQWIYFQRFINGDAYVFRVPSAGGEIEQVIQEKSRGPAPSPDGNWLLITTERGVELRPAKGRGEPRLLENIGLRRWRPDGKAIAFVRGGNLWLQELDAVQPRQLTKFAPGAFVAWGFDWTRDGERIVFARRTQSRDVVLLHTRR